MPSKFSTPVQRRWFFGCRIASLFESVGALGTDKQLAKDGGIVFKQAVVQQYVASASDNGQPGDDRGLAKNLDTASIRGNIAANLQAAEAKSTG